MIILDEIREHFAATQIGIRQLESLPRENPAWTIRMSDGYGVMISNPQKVEIKEKFANSKIESKKLIISGCEENFLILRCSIDSLRYEFAAICAQFVELGEENRTRLNIQENTVLWWNQWKTLLGNSISEKTAYSVIAEMLTMEHLLQIGKQIEWSGVYNGSHDIETVCESFEVKSTLTKYCTTVTISSQYQLKSKKRLQLYFCRMEKSLLGVSINVMVERLAVLGYNREKLEHQLSNIEFEIGTSSRNEKYKVLEKRKYEVDDNFPQITKESFKNNKLPDAIVQITYTVDLDGISYSNW